MFAGNILSLLTLWRPRIPSQINEGETYGTNVLTAGVAEGVDGVEEASPALFLDTEISW